MPDNSSTPDVPTEAEARARYEDARMQGLCHSGALEASRRSSSCGTDSPVAPRATK